MVQILPKFRHLLLYQTTILVTLLYNSIKEGIVYDMTISLK